MATQQMGPRGNTRASKEKSGTPCRHLNHSPPVLRPCAAARAMTGLRKQEPEISRLILTLTKVEQVAVTVGEAAAALALARTRRATAAIARDVSLTALGRTRSRTKHDDCVPSSRLRLRARTLDPSPHYYFLFISVCSSLAVPSSLSSTQTGRAVDAPDRLVDGAGGCQSGGRAVGPAARAPAVGEALEPPPIPTFDESGPLAAGCVVLHREAVCARIHFSSVFLP